MVCGKTEFTRLITTPRARRVVAEVKKYGKKTCVKLGYYQNFQEGQRIRKPLPEQNLKKRGVPRTETYTMGKIHEKAS